MDSNIRWKTVELGMQKVRFKSDPLKSRILAMIKIRTKEVAQHDWNLPGFQYVVGKWSVWLRLLWTLIIVANVLIFGYQFYDRVMYFLSVPVVTDYSIVFYSEWVAPSLTICSDQTPTMHQLLLELKDPVESAFAIMGLTCLLTPILMLQTNEYTFSQFWNARNVANLTTFASIVNNEGSWPLQMKESSFYYGYCPTYYTMKPFKVASESFKVRFETMKPVHPCKPSLNIVTLQDSGDPPDLLNVFTVEDGTSMNYNVEYRLYKMKSTPRTPCTSIKAFESCRAECLVRTYEKKYICRFPFVPEYSQTKLPSCDSMNSSVLDLYQEVRSFFLDFSGTKKVCDCNVPCDVKKPELILKVDPISDLNYTELELTYSMQGVIIMQQRYGFTIISLLCSIGGNIGLYLGWSVLAIAEFLQQLQTYVRQKKRKMKYSPTDPIYRKVCAVLDTKKTESIRRLLISSFSVKIFTHTLAIIICLALFAYQFYNRATLFLTYPSHVVVEIQENHTVTFPRLTMCPEKIGIVNARTDVSKQLNVYKHNIDFLDLIGFSKPKMKVVKLWKKSSPDFNQFFKPGAYNVFNYILIFHENVSIIPFSIGGCATFFIGSHQYKGTSTIFASIYNVYSKTPKMYQKWILITDEDDDFNEFEFMEIPYARCNSLIFTVQEVKKWNSPAAPCMEKEAAKTCKKKCIESELVGRLTCSLPFMMDELQTVGTCNTSRLAKEARKLYLNLMNNPLPSTCGCSVACNKRIYRTSYLLGDKVLKADIVLAFFGSNIIETYVELPAYSVVDFLCDVGSNLGLMLGLSVLTIFEFATKGIMFICPKENVQTRGKILRFSKMRPINH